MCTFSYIIIGIIALVRPPFKSYFPTARLPFLQASQHSSKCCGLRAVESLGWHHKNKTLTLFDFMRMTDIRSKNILASSQVRRKVKDLESFFEFLRRNNIKNSSLNQNIFREFSNNTNNSEGFILIKSDKVSGWRLTETLER